MDNSVITALAALFGSLIGGLTTMGTTWLTQHYSTRHERLRADIRKREALYGEFIEEASVRTIQGREHDIDDANDLVRLYSLYCRIRLLSTPPVLDAAERVVRAAGEGYMLPSAAPSDVLRGVLSESFESSPIAAFSRACREELDGLHRRL